jgi:hypothetical protein
MASPRRDFQGFFVFPEQSGMRVADTVSQFSKRRKKKMKSALRRPNKRLELH